MTIVSTSNHLFFARFDGREVPLHVAASAGASGRRQSDPVIHISTKHKVCVDWRAVLYVYRSGRCALNRNSTLPHGQPTYYWLDRFKMLQLISPCSCPPGFVFVVKISLVPQHMYSGGNKEQHKEKPKPHPPFILSIENYCTSC